MEIHKISNSGRISTLYHTKHQNQTPKLPNTKLTNTQNIKPNSKTKIRLKTPNPRTHTTRKFKISKCVKNSILKQPIPNANQIHTNQQPNQTASNKHKINQTTNNTRINNFKTILQTQAQARKQTPNTNHQHYQTINNKQTIYRNSQPKTNTKLAINNSSPHYH